MLQLHRIQLHFRNIVSKLTFSFCSKSEAAGSLAPEHKRYVDKLIVEGRRNGLHLPEADRNKVKAIKKRMSELGVGFQKNLNEDTTHLFFERKELDGVPEDLIKTLGTITIFDILLLIGPLFLTKSIPSLCKLIFSL
jgi:Zn-dependent oligopeptidase